MKKISKEEFKILDDEADKITEILKNREQLSEEDFTNLIKYALNIEPSLMIFMPDDIWRRKDVYSIPFYNCPSVFAYAPEDLKLDRSYILEVLSVAINPELIDSIDERNFYKDEFNKEVVRLTRKDLSYKKQILTEKDWLELNGSYKFSINKKLRNYNKSYKDYLIDSYLKN